MGDRERRQDRVKDKHERENEFKKKQQLLLLCATVMEVSLFPSLLHISNYIKVVLLKGGVMHPTN